MSINQIKNSIKLILTLFGFKIMANNLIIATGDTIEMSGTHNYNIISITNGSILSVESQNGKLKLICDSLFLGQSSKIIADGISTDSLNSGDDFQSVSGGGAGGRAVSYASSWPTASLRSSDGNVALSGKGAKGRRCVAPTGARCWAPDSHADAHRYSMRALPERGGLE